MSVLMEALLVLALIYVVSAWLWVGWEVWQQWRRRRRPLHLRPDRIFVRRDQAFEVGLHMRIDANAVPVEPVAADVVILLDISASMWGQRFEAAGHAIGKFIEGANLGPDKVNIGIATFNGNGHQEQALTHKKGELKRAYKHLTQPDGDTLLDQGLLCVKGMFEESPRADKPQLQRYLLLVSDGGSQEEAAALARARQLREMSVAIFCLGVEQADRAFLEKVASSGYQDSRADNKVQFYQLEQADELTRLFLALQQMIEAGRLPLNAGVTLPDRPREVRYLNTLTPHRCVGTQPLRWSLPLILAKGEQIIMRMSALPCVGWVHINRDPLSLTWAQARTDREADEQPVEPRTETNSYAYKVAVIPVLPPWLFVSLVHPLLWRPLQSRFCPYRETEMALPRVTQSALGEVTLDPVDYTRQTWTPTLCIGLGGAGIQAMLAMQSQVQDAGDNTGAVNFLAVDAAMDTPRWQMLGLARITPTLFVGIGADLYDEHCQTRMSPARHPWYLAALNEGLDRELFDTRNSCHGNRLLGRLSLHLELQKVDGALRGAIDREVDRLIAADALSKGCRILLFTSAVGGTGSAIAADMVHLLRGACEAREINAPQVDLAVIGHPVPKGQEAWLASNSAAFWLEIERLGVSGGEVDYPGAAKLNIPGFTGANYLLGSGPERFFAAGTLGLCLAAGGGGEKSLTSTVAGLYQRVAQPEGSALSVVDCRIHSASLPLYACERYLETSWLLQLLASNFGIDQFEGKFQVGPVASASKDWTLMLFQQLDDGIELTDKEPRLFRFIPGLAGADNDQIMNNLLVEILENMPPVETPRAREDNFQLASVRLLRWVSHLLREASDAGLALALAGLRQAAAALRRALHNLSQQVIRPQDRVERLALFQASAMHFINDLLRSYLELISRMDAALQRWEYLLGEGLPRALTPEGRESLGFARSLARERELALVAMADYPEVDPTALRDKLDVLLPARVARVEDKLQAPPLYWVFNDNFCARTDLYHQLLSSAENPFALWVADGRSGGECFLPEGVNLEPMGRALDNLLGFFRPWLIRGDDLLPLDRPPTPAGVDVAVSELFTPDEQLLSRGGAKPAIWLGLNREFRQPPLLITGPGDGAFSHGIRLHVDQASATAATLQRLYSRNRPALPPLPPLLVCMLADLHRLQYFLYLCVGNRVEQKIPPGKNKPYWAAHRDQGFVYLGETDKGIMSAANTFVTHQCQITGDKIIIADNWRPEDNSALNNQPEDQEIAGFLRDCRILLELMDERGGYIETLNPMGGDFMTRLFDAARSR